MRNEGASVLEWFAYHRMIGVDHFLIYTNNCEDGTDRMWLHLQKLGLATHRKNRANGTLRQAKAQTRALIRSMEDPVFQGADWVVFLDVDEFLNIHAGEGRIGDLLAANAGSDCILINWRLFGCSGHVSDAPGLVTETLVAACDPERAASNYAMSMKSLFRRARFLKAGIHRPQVHPEDSLPRVFTNPSGEAVSPAWRHVTRNWDYRTAQINHYSVPSLESVMMKFARGFTNPMDGPIAYLRNRDTNHVEDRTIQRHLPRLRAEVARLMEDPVLRSLHEEAVAWRRARIAEALAVPENRAMLAALAEESARLASAPPDAATAPSGEALARLGLTG